MVDLMWSCGRPEKSDMSFGIGDTPIDRCAFFLSTGISPAQATLFCSAAAWRKLSTSDVVLEDAEEYGRTSECGGSFACLSGGDQ